MIGVEECRRKNLQCRIGWPVPLEVSRQGLLPRQRCGFLTGFTLMEMLMSLAIFSTVVTITTDIFFSYQRTQRKTEDLQKVVSTARFISEAIVREVKEGTIDYGYADYVRSGDILSNPQTVLALKDAEGRSVIFRRADSVSAGCPDDS